ncbi:MAG: TIR domain-containing protein [Bacteroides sp.]|nr:TIR domain-containing protein [Bacteroides sp.]
MPLKPKDTIRKPERRKVTFEEASFFNGIINDEYILVLGSGIILDRQKYPETNGDINTFLLNAINEDRHSHFESLSEAVSAFPLQVSPLYSLLIDEIDYDIEDMSPELIELLGTQYFKFVFTTTPDHYVETLMRGIWDNELRVVNFSDENSIRNFYDAIKKAKGKYSQPTLFYVFGRAVTGQKNPTKFLETDSDAISYIEEWIKLDKDTPLVSFLKEKRIFSLGCNFDDWYHRFFWHILTYNFARDDFRYNDNAVLSDHTGKLEEYLSQKNVCVHSDPWAVLHYINHMLRATNGDTRFTDLLKNKTFRGKVFLSYKSVPDSGLARKIHNCLTSRPSLKIWLDTTSLLGGQQYNRRIPEAIKFSHVFLPILTPAIADVINGMDLDYINGHDAENGLPYFIQEWKWAAEVKGLTIIPLAADGYDLRGPEHLKFQSIVTKDNNLAQVSGIEIGSTDNIDMKAVEKLMESINNALGIHE